MMERVLHLMNLWRSKIKLLDFWEASLKTEKRHMHVMLTAQNWALANTKYKKLLIDIKIFL